MSNREEAERLLSLLIMQWNAVSTPGLTEEEQAQAQKRYNATREQILELMRVD